MHKRLITLMLSATITAIALTGCSDGRDSVELKNENQIRELLEYDANTNISPYDVQTNGFKLEYKIQNGKFYITFITRRWEWYGRASALEDNTKITYEVDKDTYYNLKNNYNTAESEQEVELVKALTEKFDPISVINPEGNVQQVN